MSFYFPIITSGMNLRESKQTVDVKLKDLYQDLEWLIHWEDNYNQESISKEPPSDYIYLKNIIDKIIDK